MVKINKLAVLLCGDFRTWPRLAKYIFKYADCFSDNVDYYFSTWSLTRDYWYTNNREMEERVVTDEDITKEFIKYGKNLVNYRILTNTLDKYANTYYYQSYLAKIANIMKRRYELDNNIIYDQVIEMRPDLYIAGEISDVINLNDFECILYVENNGDIELPGANDLYYRANSFGNDIMTNRFYHKKSMVLHSLKNLYFNKHIINNHHILADYISQKRIKLIQDNVPYKQVVIRSNCPAEDLDILDYDYLVKLDKEFKFTYARF